MKTVFHPSLSRGTANFGWLHSRHSFSFGQYFDPTRINFGALRVLNDDIVEPGRGFGTHPHDNMEIISIPLSGELAHKDNTGNEGVISPGEVQIMSAGTGITHSEFNNSQSVKVNFLQLWILPAQRDITPRYEQKEFDPNDRINRLQTIVSSEDPEALWINQDARLFLSSLEKGHALQFENESIGKGAYIFLLEGRLTVGSHELGKRDALGVESFKQFEMIAQEDAQILLIEIPMQ